MSTTLELKVSKPARIHSWKDLLREAEALHADSTDHSYHGSYRSRRYCANVKVHSSGSLDKAIDNLGHIPDEAEEAIREEFTDSEQSELFNQWLSDEAEFLKDWFKGCQHSSADYYDELIAKVQAGEPTNYPAIGAHPTIPAKIRELRKWQKENALFLDAFRAADDGDSITWEGRSGGYITWDPRHNIEDSADDTIRACEDTLNNPGDTRESFRDVLQNFRDTERTHHLNLALIDYLEDWAKCMDFQQELDYRVSEFFAEHEDEYATAENPFEKYADLPVSFADSLAAGNCKSGTAHWAAVHFPDRSEATIAEILAVEDSRPLARRACRKAIYRHTQAA